MTIPSQLIRSSGKSVEMNRIYFDNAATTRPAKEALDSMRPYFNEMYGNPSSAYEFGQRSREAIDKARDIIAHTLNARSSEIFFTSGGTESDNWALISAMERAEKKTGHKGHLITTAIEHPAVLNTANYLKDRGFDITIIPVNSLGLVDPDDIKAAIRPDTVLISVMMANNETGTVEPVSEIGRIAHEYGIIFHTDAVQSYGHIPVDVKAMNIDMLSASSHKFNGPMGAGFLYINTMTSMTAFIHGGSQERNRRAGTENVPGIVGTGAAAKFSCENMEAFSKSISEIRDHIVMRVMNEINGAHFNGDKEKRLPGNINFSFEGIDGESLVIALDLMGIDASGGSACSAGSHDPSHVLTAMGLDRTLAAGALRFSLGYENTMEEADRACDALKSCIERLRKNG